MHDRLEFKQGPSNTSQLLYRPNYVIEVAITGNQVAHQHSGYLSYASDVKVTSSPLKSSLIYFQWERID